MYKKLEHIKSELNEFRNKGVQRGKDIGFSYDRLPITFKPASTTYIGAAPHVGKTEFILDILIDLSCRHGWRHIIFTPETGNPTEIFAEIMSKYIGKSFVQGQHSMTEIERTKAEYFVSEHFYIVDPVDEDLTIEGFYKLVDDIEVSENISFHSTLIDPWNELTESFIPEDLGREDKYLSRILGYCRKNARNKGRHNFIINHVRDQAVQKLESGSFYFPMPSPRDMAGGQVWYRKGMLMLMLWRPPVGWIDPKTKVETVHENELIVKVAKSKPKGVSENGTYKMYFDFFRKEYYLLEGEKKIYADRGEHNFRSTTAKIPVEKLSLNEHVNTNFDGEENEEEIPF